MPAANSTLHTVQVRCKHTPTSWLPGRLTDDQISHGTRIAVSTWDQHNYNKHITKCVYRGCTISEDIDLRSTSYDGIVMVSWSEAPVLKGISTLVDKAMQLDHALLTETAVIPIPDLPAGRLVHSPTGPIDPDYHDVTIFKEAAGKGIKRAIKAGIRKPLLVLRKHADFENCELVTLLGALEALYVVSNLLRSEHSSHLMI